MLLLAALSAIILPLVLLALFHMPARRGMLIAALSIALIGSVVWGMEGLVLVASGLQAMHRAVSILWILFGAIAFLYAMQQIGAMDRIKAGFFSISHDMRVQAILVGFGLVSVLEGVSGFGTPVAIAAPLLVVMGFRPLTAAVIALVGDSVAVSFGAVGTPLLVGLNNVPAVEATNVAVLLTRVDFLMAVLLPTILVGILVTWFGRSSERLKDIAEIAPWALFVGILYAVTALLTVQFIGLEFVAIISGVVALVGAAITARFGIFTPKTVWRHHAADEEKVVRLPKPTMALWVAWAPYAVVIILLFVMRTVPLIREFSLTQLDASWYDILGLSEVSSTWHILYSPGTVLLMVALLLLIVTRRKWHETSDTVYRAAKAVTGAALALVPTLVLVQIFANSGTNTNELVSMPAYIAHAFAGSFGHVWLAAAPLLGALAAFITGSSTVATLTMSPVQYNVALDLGLPTDLAMAQQVSGANAGNIIAVHNVVAASTVTALHHQEGRIIRHTILAVGVYLACTVLSSLIVLGIMS